MSARFQASFNSQDIFIGKPFKWEELHHGSPEEELAKLDPAKLAELKSFNTMVKHRVRVEERRFLKQTVMQQKKPEDIYVFCLPSHEALEISEIYDPLGIPHKNIVAIERDKLRYEILSKKQLGFKVLINGELLNALKDGVIRASIQKHGFDIVNFDLQAFFSQDVYDCVDELARQTFLLSDKAVFMITYLKGRENEISKSLISDEILLRNFFKVLSIYRKSKSKDGSILGKQLYGFNVETRSMLQREFVDRLIGDLFLGIADMAPTIRKVVPPESTFGPKMSGLTDVLSTYFHDAASKGACRFVKQSARLSYQSGHSPMRVLMCDLERVNNQNTWTAVEYAISGQGIASCCIPIGTPQDMRNERVHKVPRQVKKPQPSSPSNAERRNVVVDVESESVAKARMIEAIESGSSDIEVVSRE